MIADSICIFLEALTATSVFLGVLESEEKEKIPFPVYLETLNTVSIIITIVSKTAL